jgi:hypothetical protein
MQSVPKAIVDTKVMTFAPAFASPGGHQDRPVVDKRVDRQPLRSGNEHDPRVCDRTLIVESHLDTVQSDGAVIVHHEGDLLRGPRLPLQS